ncbi:probable isoprenylcysteine alpha-carbonyl methylesterase ICMEL1 isoform X2 [Prunus dulcis]|uniref:probable isoprenylcysteine alpha-carbonyl methylesterase ICMEL1 isoform X2 n=1 Tax=Prunus dulcis TaxID=3755 RepID=UPI0014834CAA|nr:probable isoprenylcysteine alpha-carbonyl methylesterase ICMEL1 isoform X2 [Prunus dulcis]
MPSQQILPITYHPPSVFSSSSSPTEKLLLKDAEDDPTTRLLLFSHFEEEDEEKGTPIIKPLLPRASSYITSTTNGANKHQQRRRRTASDSSLSSLSDDSRNNSLGREVEHAAAETFLVTRLSLKLLRYLGLQMDYKISCPWLLFIFTHARIYSSYKAWGSLLGQQLSERDIIVACIDYRNFPQGTISDMVKDASQGISFVCNHIADYGGDPNRIYLMGQSAGAHIGACALIDQAIKEAGEGESTSWSVSQIKAYFGLSGGYNLLNLVDHFHRRGLYRSIFLGIMEGEQSLQRFSPELMIQDLNISHAASLLPPVILFHGTADYSIPSDASKNFAETLQRLGVKAKSILYEGKTHTDLFLQDPMRGGKDDMFEDLVAIIHEGDSEALAKDAVAPPRKRLVPEFMLKLAHRVSPF